MQGPVTIDASVFLNAYNEEEEGQPESQRLLSNLRQAATPMICPTLLLPEVSATISRGTGNPELAQQFSASLQHLPHMVLVQLDHKLAGEASAIAANQRLRGSDAVYAAVAVRFASTLITLDKEMHDRAADQVETRYPVEVLADLGYD
ncbi:MAG: PIN domain-containing protein [Chloroflexi bacterium]|nr:MAG: PIN domain-containing protein [Chloroflexota bacterium]MBL1195148.1 PIN domain-containing protein [Chloroflexota bacterium]NOH12433.1 type II toxin-antitoxin system VapC family toxin [Chloroflexota bacterium]